MSKLRNQINLILQALKHGDKSKEKVLYDLTYNYLKVIALKYAVDKNDYEDILIEAYLRVFRYVYNADLDKDGYNWLCKIVQNVAYDFNKKYAPSIPLDEITFTKFVGDIEEDLSKNDEAIRMICSLNEEEQRLIYLRFYEMLSYAEIAEITGSKKSTVHKQIKIILKNLEKKFD